MTAVAAMAENRVIGAGGRIPWHLPEDFRWFKKLTMGGAVLMGRRTFESLGRPLPGRLNLVATRSGAVPEGVTAVRDLAAFDPTSVGCPVFVIGGAEIYRALLPRCGDLYLTRVRGEYEGDVRFPPFEDDFVEVARVLEAEGFDVVLYRNRRMLLAAAGDQGWTG